MLDAIGGPQSRTAADRLIAIGILAALPTAATGIADWGDTQTKERRVGLVHATANTTALALFSGSLLARRRGGPHGICVPARRLDRRHRRE